MASPVPTSGLKEGMYIFRAFQRKNMSKLILPTDTVDLFLVNLQKLFVDGYGLPAPQKYSQLTDGLINQTYVVDGCWILQHVNDIFGAQVNEDIATLTPLLNQNGVTVPLLLKSMMGMPYVMGENYGLPKGPWRIMTRLEGKTFHFVTSIEQIRVLARTLAKFHKALHGCHYVFKHTRPGVHDFDRHAKALENAVESMSAHRLYGQVKALFEKIRHLTQFVRYQDVMACSDLRIIHGDPKISNFLFSDGRITGVLDLDTMARSRAAFDVGDAIRSWCNPHPEDVEPTYEKEYAREALGLYMEEAKCLSRDELHSLPNAAPFITLELAMRFAKDALCEDYFGFDPKIGHGEHSLMRANAMYLLCTQMLEDSICL